ncbi:MAG: glycosyltransferase family 4 protein, partial [Rubricoccaceae bacterium]
APSRGPEAFANTVVEAKRAGVPSVVFPSGGLPEAITAPGRDGLVCEAPDAPALARALAQMLDRVRDDRPAVQAAVARSMDRLGLTPGAFAAAWADVYGFHSPALDA